jgi:hypothetical protein
MLLENKNSRRTVSTIPSWRSNDTTAPGSRSRAVQKEPALNRVVDRIKGPVDATGITRICHKAKQECIRKHTCEKSPR